MKHPKSLVPLLALFLCASFQPVLAAGLELTETADQIRITLHGKPVMEYVKTARPVPEGIEKHFSRSGYIHPIFTPTGQELTGDYPKDHAHQHALFFAWTKANYNGKEVDFWNQAKDSGKIEFRDVVDRKKEEKKVSFGVKHAFMVKIDDTWIDVIHEVWTVTVHQTPADYFLFDVASVQQCVTDKPLILAKYHYGGMAIRGNYQWLKQNENQDIKAGDLQFLTSEGKDRRQGNHTRANWVALSGRIDGQDVSAAVFCSPKNFRAPQSVRIHPDKPYFCFSPMVEGAFKIAPGEEYVSRYRYLVTSKTVDVDLIKKNWDDYMKAEGTPTNPKITK